MGKENGAYIHSRVFSILKNKRNPAAQSNMDKRGEIALREIIQAHSVWSYLYAKSKNIKLMVAERMVLLGAGA